MNHSNTEVTKEQMLYDAEQLGYTIKLDKREETTTVTLCSKTNSYVLPRRYANEYTEHEIKLDCVYDLLRWAGLHYETRLTYKV